MDRCIARIDLLPVEAPSDAFEISCVTEPADICPHTEKPAACFEEYRAALESRVDALLASLPETVQGTSFTAQRYPKRLADVKADRQRSDRCIEFPSYVEFIELQRKWLPDMHTLEEGCALVGLASDWTRLRGLQRSLRRIEAQQ